MSIAPLPNSLDVRKLAAKGAEINAVAPVSSLTRFVDLLADQEGSVEVNLRFYVDEQRFKCIGGQIKASVNVCCQRCLEPMQVVVDTELSLGIVWSEDDAQRLPKTLEPLIVGEELIDLADVVSEELILSLPYVNYHKPEDCQQAVGFSSADPEAIKAVAEEERDNPFNVLAQLKRDQ